MALSWNEIKNRAIGFSKEWESEEREHAESQSFWNDFFNIFGINRRRVASFEEAVKKADLYNPLAMPPRLKKAHQALI